MVTSDVDVEQLVATVHRNTFAPSASPFTVVPGALALVKTPFPETTVQVPVPEEGWFP
jgi:hypothetical protein